MRGVLQLLFAIVLGLAALVASDPARAESRPFESCIAPIPAGEDAGQVIAASQGFDCATSQNQLGSDDFVVALRFAPLDIHADDPLVLRMSSVWMKRAKVHFRYADGGQAEFDFNSGEIARVLTIGAVFEVPVPYRAATLE